MEVSRKRLRAFLRKVRDKGLELSIDNLESFKQRINGQGLSNVEACRIAFPQQYEVYRALQKENSKLARRETLKLIAQGDFNRCQKCNKPVGFNAKYCRSCNPTTEQHKCNVEKAMIARGGYPIQTAKGKTKFKRTMIERHGVEWSGQSPELLEKSFSTHADHYGHRHWVQTEKGKERIKETNHDPVVQAQKVIKWCDTLQRKHGDQWRAVNHERLSNARYKYHSVSIGGRTYRCQGYEPVALKWLHKHNVSLRGVTLSKISYPYIKKETGRRALYFPDIVLSNGWIIEVKSNYTAGLGNTEYAKTMWKQLQEKSRAVSNEGHCLDVLVCDSKQVNLRIRNPHTISRRDALRLYSDALARLD